MYCHNCYSSCCSKNSGFTEAAASSGAYFGISATVRSLAYSAGFSSILVNIIAFTFAAVFSEIFKIRRRTIVPQRTRVADGPTMYELMRFNKPSMLDIMRYYKTENVPKELKQEINFNENVDPIDYSARPVPVGEICRAEIIADFAKWFFYYSFMPSDTNMITKLEDTIIIGSIAGFIYQIIREQEDKAYEKELTKSMKVKNIKRPKDFGILRFARSSLENSGQLLTYEAARQYVMDVSPYFNIPIQEFGMNLFQ